MTDSYVIRVIVLLVLFVISYFIVLDVIALIADAVSLKIVKNTIGRNVKNQITKKHFGLIFAFTVISYIISIFGLFIMFAVANGEFTILTFLLAIYRLVSEPITNPQATFFFVMTVLIAFVSNTVFNYFIVFRKVTFSRIRRFFSAVIVSMLTAPYFFFLGFLEIMVELGI